MCFTRVTLILAHASAQDYFSENKCRNCYCGLYLEEIMFPVKTVHVWEVPRNSHSLWVYIRTGSTSGSCFVIARPAVSSGKNSGWVTQGKKYSAFQAISAAVFVWKSYCNVQPLRALCNPCWKACEDCRPKMGCRDLLLIPKNSGILHVLRESMRTFVWFIGVTILSEVPLELHWLADKL